MSKTKPVVQLLRHALDLNLSAAFGSDGRVIVCKGSSFTSLSPNTHCEQQDDLATSDSDAPVDEIDLKRVEYWANWQVADDYPVPGDQNWRLWAWEFMRRNKQYALLVTWILQLPKGIQRRDVPQDDDPLEYVLCEPAPLAGQKNVGDYKKHCRESNIHFVVVTPMHVLRHCWSVNQPLQPNSEFSDLTVEQQMCFFAADTPVVLIPTHLSKNSWLPDFPFQEIRTHISDNEIFIKFDLKVSHKIQLDRAYLKLVELRKSYNKQARLTEIPWDDLDLVDESNSLEKICDVKNYTDSLHLQLRIFDSVNISEGYLSKELRQQLVDVFSSESDSRVSAPIQN